MKNRANFTQLYINACGYPGDDYDLQINIKTLSSTYQQAQKQHPKTKHIQRFLISGSERDIQHSRDHEHRRRDEETAHFVVPWVTVLWYTV